MRIVFVGPPGSGKGTQCAWLSERLSIPHLSTGEMLRETVLRSRCDPPAEDDQGLGQQVASYIHVGRLAPDDVVLPIVIRRLAQSDCARGCLFDGFPRTLRQAELLDQHLAATSQRLDMVLNLVVEPSELVRRLLQRATAQNRVDDTPQTIAARLEVFETQTSPVLSYYQERGILREIDAMQSPTEVFQQILAQLPRSI
jgi:adenylate kinase